MNPTSAEPIDRVELVEGYGVRWRGVGAGPVLVWAHDALASIDADDDAPVVDFDELGRAHRLIRFDAIGHGRSAGVFDPADHEWRSRGEALIDLCRRLELERFAVGGFGAGAASALHAAVRSPARVERLVLVAPSVDWSVPGCVRRLPRPVGIGLLIGTAEPVRLIARALPVPHRRGPVGEMNAAGWRHLVGAPRDQFNAVLIGAARSSFPEPEELATIDAPALVLAFRGDPTHPVGSAIRLAEALPDAQLEVAPDHDAIRGWAGRIVEFLAE